MPSKEQIKKAEEKRYQTLAQKRRELELNRQHDNMKMANDYPSEVL